MTLQVPADDQLLLGHAPTEVPVVGVIDRRPSLVMPGVELEACVASITASVAAKSDEAELWEIERVVVEELLRMRDARITLYLPILVERAVLERIRGTTASKDELAAIGSARLTRVADA
jgi:hypothetical protein